MKNHGRYDTNLDDDSRKEFDALTDRLADLGLSEEVREDAPHRASPENR